MASNLITMASNLTAMAFQPTSDGLQPNSHGLQPDRNRYTCSESLRPFHGPLHLCLVEVTRLTAPGSFGMVPWATFPWKAFPPVAPAVNTGVRPGAHPQAPPPPQRAAPLADAPRKRSSPRHPSAWAKTIEGRVGEGRKKRSGRRPPRTGHSPTRLCGA